MKWYKRIRLALTLALLPALAACGAGGGVSAEEEPAGTLSAVPALEEAAPEEACVHQFAQGDNTAEHEAAGYCGNTVTTVSRESRMGPAVEGVLLGGRLRGADGFAAVSGLQRGRVPLPAGVQRGHGVRHRLRRQPDCGLRPP